MVLFYNRPQCPPDARIFRRCAVSPFRRLLLDYGSATLWGMFLWLTNPSAGAALPSHEPLAQSSRRTPVVISEIMYQPPPNQGLSLEYVELYNAFGTPEDISGYQLTGDIDYTFPAATVLPPRGFLVVARDPAALSAHYGLTNVVGPFQGSLPNRGGTVRLRHRTGAIFLEVEYRGEPPWPVAAAGLGHSLELARPSLGENDFRAWAASDRIGGSPGRASEYGAEESLRGVVINEFLANTDAPLRDYLELYNHRQVPADISHCLLSDDPEALRNGTLTNPYRIPPGTVLPPGGFVVFDELQLGFALKAAGEVIFLVNSNQTRVLDAVAYTGQANGVSTGRYPDGAGDFYPLKDRTPGLANAPFSTPQVVINEFMFAPISGSNADEYIELHNQGDAAIPVGGWKFTRGIDFEMPPATTIPAGGYLVVTKNITHLLVRYPTALNVTNTIGNYSGALTRGGERLVLSAPDQTVITNQDGTITTNTIWVDQDEVTYRRGGRWGTWADRGGSSLEVIDPRSARRWAANWADSDEAGKAPWTLVQSTGVLDHGDVPADQLQVLLQGAGECIIDDVEVLDANGVNQITNSTFEQGAEGWTAEGTQKQSGREAVVGYLGGHGYHVRAVDRGDNQVNRIRTPLLSPLAPGATATLRAKVRWLKGHPEILFRLRGKWLETAVRMALPSQLGTPGMPNSRLRPNAPPAIFDVNHSPVLPAGGEPVVVTARIHDSDGVAGVVLKYRLDPETSATPLPMLDNGIQGDAVAGDGIYSVMIPGQAAGTVVAFHIQAIDKQSASLQSIFPNDAPIRECLIRYGDPPLSGTMPVYRLWMTQATFNTWSSQHKLDNSPLDVTFVLGDHRAVYNAQGRYAGSPYISPSFNTPAGNRCGYSLNFPPDDRFLGSVDLVLDWAGGHGNENTGIQEQMAYWIADQMNLPYSLRYYIRLVVQGVTDRQRGGIFEAINQPSGEFARAWSPADTEGDLYKIERSYEFNDNGQLMVAPMPRLENYTTTGGAKKTARYRWNWLKRAYESANDFSSLFNLVDAVNTPDPAAYTAQVEAIVDIEEWMRLFAFEHIINNFDSWGHEIAKNMYAYKPVNGRWQLYAFDLDWLMLVSPLYSSRYAGGNGPLFIADDPTVVRMYEHPPFRRAYFRAVQDAVSGPLASANSEPVMDAKYQWLIANGLTLSDGAPLANPAAVKQWFRDRRRFLQEQLDQVAASFSVAAPAAPIPQTNTITLTGTAPIRVKTIAVNGRAFEPAWTTITNFVLTLPLAELETNTLLIQAYDGQGQAMADAHATLPLGSRGVLPPQFVNVTFTPKREVMLHWLAQPKQIYQVQYTDDLFGNRWLNLGSEITADGPAMATLDERVPAQARFYRIIQVQ